MHKKSKQKMTIDQKIKAGLIKTPLQKLKKHFNYYYLF
jgi:hypothetical protein